MAGRELINAKGNVVSDDRVEVFRTGLRGEVIRPGDAAYESARRIWNATIDKRPGIIARCLGVADVIDAVKLRARTSLWLPFAAVATTSAAGPSATAGWSSTCPA